MRAALDGESGILRIVLSTRRRRDRRDDGMPMKIALAAILLLALAGCQSPAPVAEPAARGEEKC